MSEVKNSNIRSVKNFLAKRKIENWENELKAFNDEFFVIPNNHEDFNEAICEKIQENFTMFSSYISKKYPKQ